MSPYQLSVSKVCSKLSPQSPGEATPSSLNMQRGKIELSALTWQSSAADNFKEPTALRSRFHFPTADLTIEPHFPKEVKQSNGSYGASHEEAKNRPSV